MTRTIFYNGTIYTMAGTVAEAILIEDDLIAAVGTNAEILARKSSGTLCHNLNGNCMLPGFIDSHCHLLSTAEQLQSLNLQDARSYEDIIALGEAYIKDIPPGTWVFGMGFNQDTFHVPSMPTRDVLDQITTQHPILIERVCGHVAVANSLALKIAGIAADTKIEGGNIGVDHNGRLTGILSETAIDLLANHIPPVTKEQLKENIMLASKHMLASGITSIHSNDFAPEDLHAAISLYRELEGENAPLVRNFQEVRIQGTADISAFQSMGYKRGDGTKFFRIGNLKLFTDGSLGGRTAYLRAPYWDAKEECGIPIHSPEALDALILAAHNMDMQVALHAIGDGALDLCLHAIIRAQATSPKKPLRHRIVHCQIGDMTQYNQMARAGICADIQPPFIPTDMHIAQERLGGERTATTYLWKTLMDMGIPLGGGSDSPVEPFSPLYGIHCAVTRQDRAGNPSGGWMPEERLSMEEAVSLYTKGSAYLAFEENIKGTITPGKLADLVILSQDIINSPPQALLKTDVLATIVGGNILYQKERICEEGIL